MIDTRDYLESLRADLREMAVGIQPIDGLPCLSPSEQLVPAAPLSPFGLGPSAYYGSSG